MPLYHYTEMTARARMLAHPEDMIVVSVIIPCYNQAHFLSDAIESVLAQSYPCFETIVIDDGSPDNTAEVAARYPGVRYVRQTNQGLSAARNTGIRESSGQYLVFLDADDRLLPHALRDGLACFDEHPEAAFVSGHHRYINRDGSLRNEYPPTPIDDHPYVALLKRNYIGMHATVMYTRTVFDAVGTFDTTLKSCEDYDLYLRIARRFPVYHHHHLAAEYRWHGANMTNNSGRMLKSAMRVLRSQWPYFRVEPEYVRACRLGIRFWRNYFGGLVVTRLRKNVGEKRWRLVAQNLLTLVRFLPQWLSAWAMELALRMTMLRYRLARRQHHSSQQP